MTYSRYVVKNALRNRLRTTLTVVSIGLSLLLMIVLATVLEGLLNPPETEGSELRIAVRGSTSLAEQLPFSYEQQLVKVPHVELVMPLQWFGGQYKDDAKNFFPNFAAGADKLFEMFPELEIDAAAKKAFVAEKTAAIAEQTLAKKFGWKVGDRITLQGTIFPFDPEMTLVGIFDSPQPNVFYFHLDYLDEAMKQSDFGGGKVGTYWLKADSPQAIPGIIDTVDKMFANSAVHTKTETEKAFRLGFVSMLGNVKVLLGSVLGVVVFTMLLVAASTMAMTVRERLREVAILKSLGYPRYVVLFLIVGEAAFIAFLGGVVGCVAAFLMGLLDINTATMGFIPKFHVEIQTYALALIGGAMIGVLSGIIPAFQASNMTITEAMRRLS